jgi:hypothetical protein
MIKTKIGLTRFDKDFNKIERIEQPSRSWLIAMWDWMFAQMSDSDLPNCIDITNTARTISSWDDHGRHAAWGRVAAGGGIGGEEDTYYSGSERFYSVPSELIGVQVGSNNAAATPSDYALGTKIAHGVAGGKLLYGGCEIANPTFSDPNGEMIIRRFFTNVSGGNVTVEECGIYQAVNGTSDHAYYFCIARDIVAPAVVVADTEILMVTYTVQITV